MGFELKTGFWSMVDQGAVSAGNFLTTILLARALLPSEYGIYALLFALMLFMISLHAAVIVYGLSLDGAAGTDATLRPLAGGSLVLTAGLGTVLGAAIGTVAMFSFTGYRCSPGFCWLFYFGNSRKRHAAH